MGIKVLHILNRLVIGGPSMIALSIFNNLPPEFDCKLVAGGKDDEEELGLFLFDSLKENIIIIPEMRRSLNIFNDFRSYLAIKKIIKDFQPDIIHTHASKAGAIGRLAAHIHGVPIILHTFHGHVFHSYFGSVVTRLFISIEKYLAKKSSAIIAISPSQKIELVDRFNICSENKIRVIRNGIDLKKFSEEQPEKRLKWRKKFNINENTILVGIVGRMAPIKNHQMFVEVVSKVLLESRHIDLKFLIVGDGETRLHVQQLLSEKEIAFRYIPDGEPSGDEKVLLTSWERSNDEVYAGLDIVCLTSLNEGTPTTLLEAQAAKKPIVSTMVGGVIDSVLENKSAFLAPSGDVETFSKYLLKLISEPNLRKEMGEQGYDFVHHNYSIEKFISSINELYLELMKK